MAAYETSTPAANRPLVVVLAGATASGKTAAAIALAQHFNTAVLSADSRQCYREMDIGVAKPNADELAAVPHYFINTHSIHQPVDAALYEQYGLGVLQNLFTKHAVVIVAGGTGLYIKALCEGVDAMPAIPETIRGQVRLLYEQAGLIGLQAAIATKDPLYFAEGEIQNPQRLMRALEVVMATGQSIRHFQQQQAAPRPFEVMYIGLEVPRPLLIERINQRVDAMVAAGLEEEVRSLLPYRHLNALQTVGYQELFNYFDGQCTFAEAIDQIKIHTRQYAKRQITWFKKVPGLVWYAPQAIPEMINAIEQRLPPAV